MLGRWLILLACLWLTAPGAAIAAPQADDDDPAAEAPRDVRCVGKYASTLCEPKVRAALARHFGLRPAEEVRPTKGVQVRIFALGHYYEPYPAIVLADVGSAAPTAQVYMSREWQPGRELAYTVRLTPENAREAARLVREVRTSPYVGRRQNEVTYDEDGIASIPICLHPWTMVVEVIDGGGVTHRLRTNCAEDDVYPVAYGFADRILDQLPDCRRVRSDDVRSHYNNAFIVFGASRSLQGDPVSAAAVKLISSDNEVENWRGPDDENLPALLADDIRLRTPDVDLQGAEAVAGFLRSFKAYHYTDTVRGLSASEAVVTGSIRRSDADGRLTEFKAPLTMRWVERGGRWRIAAMEIGAFEQDKPGPRRRADDWAREVLGQSGRAADRLESSSSR